MKKKLDRNLGLYSAIAISAGTMIGSAIFVLAGASYKAAGPSASLAVFLAGTGALFTALSFAELVTVIPRAGGGYAYVREAAGNGIIAFVTGWGFWLGYTISCGLFAIGFGHFLNYFFNFIPVSAGAYALILYVTATNIKGVENTGALQSVITTGLVFILALYVIYGSFFVDISRQKSFLPQGLGGMFSAMGFLYVTYIGYGLVTTASEEIITPEKTIPRAIIISLAVVIFLKTAIFFIGASITDWKMLVPEFTNTPLTDTAIKIAGSFGGYVFAIAGIFATVSSINTSMMAASRTSFAMARDHRLPAVFSRINGKTKTPIFSVLFAAVIVMIAASVKNLEHIAMVTSLFALTGYSFVNVALIIFRKKEPGLKRAFRVPLYPLTPIAGIAFNLFLIAQLALGNLPQLAIATAITLAGIMYYYLLIPKLKEAPEAMSVQPVAAVQLKVSEIEQKYKVLVPLASPLSAEALVNMGLLIARSYRGVVIPVHIMVMPEVIPLDDRYDEFVSGGKKYQQIIRVMDDIVRRHKTVAEPLLILARDMVSALKKTAREKEAGLILLGWRPGALSHRMSGGVILQVISRIPVDVAIFKKDSGKKVGKILYPYGGDFHSQKAAEIVKRIATANKADVTFLRIVDKKTPVEEIAAIRKVMEEGMSQLRLKGKILVTESNSVTSAIIEESSKYDLLIMGAGDSWGVKSHITGKQTDKILATIKCGGLVLRKHLPFMERKTMRGAARWLKKSVFG